LQPQVDGMQGATLMIGQCDYEIKVVEESALLSDKIDCSISHGYETVGRDRLMGSLNDWRVSDDSGTETDFT
jgi:hypothetical protein